MAKRSPTRVDTLVGERIRTFRLAKRVSQTQLGTAIGVTFQQIQKYEKGVNRAGAGRLTQIAQALDVPVYSLFPDSEHKPQKTNGEAVGELFDMLQSRMAMQMLRAFSQIDKPPVKHALMELAKVIAGAPAIPEPPRRRRGPAPRVAAATSGAG